MKVKMLRNPSIALGCELTEGQTGDVCCEIASRLISLGIAVQVEEQPSVIHAVPDPPAISSEPSDSTPGSEKQTPKRRRPKQQTND